MTTEIVKDLKLEEELQQRAPRVLKHMNDDHQDSIKAYALAFGEHPQCSSSKQFVDYAKLTGLDRHGFFLQVTLKDGTILENVRVPYQGSVTSSKDLHMEAVNMHRLAFEKLGYTYKIRNGYYAQVAKMIGFQTYKKAKKNPSLATAAVVSIAAVVFGGFVWNQNSRRRK